MYKMLLLISTLIIVISLFFVYLGYVDSNTGKFLTRPNSAQTQVVYPDKIELFNIVNKWRQSLGLTPYVESEFLCSVAETRIGEIKTHFSHGLFDADRFCDQICYLGENLSRVKNNSTEVLSEWLASKPHKKLLEGDFTHTCIATDGEYVVQIFGYY